MQLEKIYVIIQKTKNKHMIHQQIKGEVKQAMLDKDQVKLSVVRGLLSAFTNEAVAKGKKPDELLSDEDSLTVIRRAAKQRKDSIEQFQAGGRADLAGKEEEELKILETYLPQLMARDEIKRIALAKQEEHGIVDRAKAGQLTGILMKELKGQADGGDVKAVVDELLAD
jgi:uncharacterized protein